MDREILKPLVGKRRQKFTGVFIRTGFKHEKNKDDSATILLRDVKLDGEIPVTGHLWLDYTKDLAKLNMLWPGDVISFTATVVDYKHAGSKSAIGDVYVTDDFYTAYGVRRPMKFKKIHEATIPEDVEIKDFTEIRQSESFTSDLNNFLKLLSYQISIHEDDFEIPEPDIDELKETKHTEIADYAYFM